MRAYWGVCVRCGPHSAALAGFLCGRRAGILVAPGAPEKRGDTPLNSARRLASRARSWRTARRMASYNPLGEGRVSEKMVQRGSGRHDKD